MRRGSRQLSKDRDSMIILLGASGYVGRVFQRELASRGERFVALSRKDVDYTRFDCLIGLLRQIRPSFLINAAGYTGRPNVDACEVARADTLLGCTLFPLSVSHACQVTGTSWGHVSSGCIYNGALLCQGGKRRIETHLTRPEIRQLIESQPNVVQGFTELDEPNFSFRHPPCSFYSGTKALAEEALANDSQAFIWRLRIPFDQFDNARNYLSKLQRYPKVYDNFNSLSHLDDFVAACLDLVRQKAEPGIYNMTNPGFVTARQVVEMIRQIQTPQRDFEFWEDDEQFYRDAAKTPRSNCILDVTKLLSTGVNMRPVEAALTDALEHWVVES
jgi:dTDP-4-dehydrorhamnose reductase